MILIWVQYLFPIGILIHRYYYYSHFTDGSRGVKQLVQDLIASQWQNWISKPKLSKSRAHVLNCCTVAVTNSSGQGRPAGKPGRCSLKQHLMETWSRQNYIVQAVWIPVNFFIGQGASACELGVKDEHPRWVSLSWAENICWCREAVWSCQISLTFNSWLQITLQGAFGLSLIVLAKPWESPIGSESYLKQPTRPGQAMIDSSSKRKSKATFAPSI